MKILITLIFALLMVGCSSDSVAGNGTETGNPRVAALVLDTSGLPVRNSNITICKDSYIPHSQDSLYTTTTNNKGQFEVEVSDSGSYSVVLFNSDSSMGIKTSVATVTNENFIRDSISLSPTKSIILHRPISIAEQEIFAEGTTLSLSFPAGSDSLLLSHVPVGNYRFIDMPTKEVLATTTITASDTSPIEIHLKPLLLVVAPYGWDSASGVVKQLVQLADSSLYRLHIADASRAVEMLTVPVNFNGVVILEGSEQHASLITILDTLPRPILVSSSAWFPFLHMAADTSIGMESSASLLFDGLSMGTHPLLTPLNLYDVASLTVVEKPVLLSWGKPSSSANIIAYGIQDQTKKFIFSYPAGALMEGKNAPSVRIGFPFGNGQLSATGTTLFATALSWIVE